jgi:hypothetical protein
MKHLEHGFFLLALALAAAACGDDGGNDNPDANTPGIDANEGPPDKPALGDQMDRMGRPAINTALNHAFDPDETTKQAAKDAWNENDARSTWLAAFAADVRGGLGIIDGIDANCGNQLGADLDPTTRYAALAGLLTDDEVYVNSAPTGGCNSYLAVEANALGIVPNDDCGGRVMSYDVIETSYSSLAAGVLSGVDDGIADEAVASDPTTFPFLADPL